MNIDIDARPTATVVMISGSVDGLGLVDDGGYLRRLLADRPQ